MTAAQSIMTLRDPVEANLTFHDIITAAAARFGVTFGDVVSARRTRDIATLRFCIAYVGRMLTRLSYPQMGRIMCRDHSSIMHGVQMVETLPQRYLPVVNAILDELGCPAMSVADIARSSTSVSERIAA